MMLMYGVGVDDLVGVLVRKDLVKTIFPHVGGVDLWGGGQLGGSKVVTLG